MEAPPFASSTKTLPFRSSSPVFLPKTLLNFRRPRSFSGRASAAADSVVTLLDYGAGNVRSVRNAIRHLGFDVKDVQTLEDILNAERLVFPGVGAFAAAMDVLNKNGMAEAICSYIEKDRPFLGICLGLQLLFESSEENGPVKGLGLIRGVVGRFDSSNGFRVPHIGWNALKIEKDSLILDDVGSHHVYFVHSYRAMQVYENKDWVSSTCNCGDNFIASIRRGNVHAVQFHPEKSGGKISFLSPVYAGLLILRRFLYPKVTFLTERKALKLAKRVIACLDGRTNDRGDLVVTKGDQYDVREHTKENEVRELGKPVELGRQYYKDGADELSKYYWFRDFPLGDLPMLQLDCYMLINFLILIFFHALLVLRYTSENVFVPLTVGGGIRDFTDANGRHYSSLEVASEYFRCGADKISIGSDAVYAAEEYLRTGISRVYGNQAVVVSIDPCRVYVKNPKDLAKPVEELGAGEILLNCIDCDGQKKGFDIDIINSGAGSAEHFSEVFRKTNTSAALAAGIFHRKEVPIQSVKEHLLNERTEVRICTQRCRKM
ncbi:imidazole glycerol phosphate synthase hisHF [Pyrus ussuriensis x Pyrus communis]|uniref:Imidazole glycerol phosphate synthase hisHF n=1 Tax=Pyrus ussuriensis x Pyrus communis TaxID=2448454 RepID=A0A5N5FS76_9ROSA|nr:imidazole glycerol phosphate synthase hisHF [Pyrus ussuriensis x Pyrus communis]